MSKAKMNIFYFGIIHRIHFVSGKEIEEIGSSSIGKKRYMLIYGDKYMDIEIPNENFGTEYEYPDNNSI